jgi:hypothetical protein
MYSHIWSWADWFCTDIYHYGVAWADWCGMDIYHCQVTWADWCDMYLLIDLGLIQWESLSIWPAHTDRVQSLFRPICFDELQYYSGWGLLARAVQQIVKLGIQYGMENSTEWSV